MESKYTSLKQRQQLQSYSIDNEKIKVENEKTNSSNSKLKTNN